MYKPIIKSPAYYIEWSLTLRLWIKQARLFIKEVTPKVNMYVTDPTYSYEALVIKKLTISTRC
jgi:hypothetical protein